VVRLDFSIDEREVKEAEEVKEEKERGKGYTPRGDGKYAQSSEGTGDRGATWRIRRALAESRTGKLLISLPGVPPPSVFS
jgi:hypothetical protein